MLTAEVKENGVVVAKLVLEPKGKTFKGELYKGETKVKIHDCEMRLEVWVSKIWP